MQKLTDIKRELIEDFGLAAAEINKLKKAEALELLSSFHHQTQLLDDVEMVEPKDEEVSEEIPVNETREAAKEQQKKIMDLFDESELVNGNPTVHGLRRISSLKFGNIENYFSKVEQVPNMENNYRATVSVNLQFSNGFVTAGAADAGTDNAPDPYSRHPVALAETRAESRALRRALNIIKPSHEEADGFTNTNVHGNEITDTQLYSIKIQCEKMKIDVDKFFSLKFGVTSENSKTLSDVQGLEALEQLKQYRNHEEEIPDKIK